MSSTGTSIASAALLLAGVDDRDRPVADGRAIVANSS
jgi:hypothetical protein